MASFYDYTRLERSAEPILMTLIKQLCLISPAVAAGRIAMHRNDIISIGFCSSMHPAWMVFDAVDVPPGWLTLTHGWAPRGPPDSLCLSYRALLLFSSCCLWKWGALMFMKGHFVPMEENSPEFMIRQLITGESIAWGVLIQGWPYCLSWAGYLSAFLSVWYSRKKPLCITPYTQVNFSSANAILRLKIPANLYKDFGAKLFTQVFLRVNRRHLKKSLNHVRWSHGGHPSDLVHLLF